MHCSAAPYVFLSSQRTAVQGWKTDNYFSELLALWLTPVFYGTDFLHVEDSLKNLTMT